MRYKLHICPNCHSKMKPRVINKIFWNHKKFRNMTPTNVDDQHWNASTLPGSENIYICSCCAFMMHEQLLK